MGWGYGDFPRYVPVAERRADARRQMQSLSREGRVIEPVQIEGRAIARSFWGKRWCEHLESFSDYSNRLPRGRTYVRNGSVCHLAVKPGQLEAFVSGSSLYRIDIRVSRLEPEVWQDIKRRCAGQVGSVLELLQGKLSEQVMSVVTDPKAGLFPQQGQITLACNCLDWATMCKHVAAVLYGVGSRLDERPDLLFTLRGVDPQELISTELALPDASSAPANRLADDQLSKIFDIDIDDNAEPSAPEPMPARKAKHAAKAPQQKQPTPARDKARSTSAATPRTRPRKATAHTNPLPSQPSNLRPTGKSVARLRRQLKLTAAVFAEELGVSAASVYRWESIPGRLQLQDRSLRALAALRQKANRKRARVK